MAAGARIRETNFSSETVHRLSNFDPRLMPARFGSLTRSVRAIPCRSRRNRRIPAYPDDRLAGHSTGLCVSLDAAEADWGEGITRYL